jgi:hypothetical protein
MVGGRLSHQSRGHTVNTRVYAFTRYTRHVHKFHPSSLTSLKLAVVTILQVLPSALPPASQISRNSITHKITCAMLA